MAVNREKSIAWNRRVNWIIHFSPCTPGRARVGSIEKFGAGGGRLAYQKKATGFKQENCYGHTARQSADSMAERPMPRPEPTVAENSGPGVGRPPSPDTHP